MILFFWALLITFNQTLVNAQTDVALLRDLAEENKKSVEALVLYPSETRLAILETTKHPEVLIKMQDMRDKTSSAFRTLIEDFPRATQEVFYDLCRYPGLVEALVTQKNDPGAQRTSLAVLAEENQANAFGVVERQMPTLVQINQLNQTSDKAFKGLTGKYPASAKQAFEHLLGLPEVIDILNEDLRFTILVGETYQNNPAWVLHKMDSLNLAVARSHAEELENWKSTLENDPDAKTELQSAAKEYADENGYTDYDDAYYDRPDNIVIHRHYYQPYPYWYGYPWWEPYPRWRPYPWWWDWGCQFPPRGVVIVYMPSYHFMHWYFAHPNHHNHYNHLSAHFVNHYYGHRRSGTTISEGVREWHDRNRTVISDDFLSDKKRLPERLKEYGRFEQARQDYNARNPKKVANQEDFLAKNARKFPEIKRSQETAKTEIIRERDVTRDKSSNWAPAKAPAKPEPTPEIQPARPPRVITPSQRPTQPEKPSTREPAPTQRPKTQPDDANDYHRQKWEQPKPAPETQRRTPTPTRERTPAPAPKTKQSVPQKKEKIGN